MRFVGHNSGRRLISVYLTGGSTSVLMGFRDGTIDVDLSGELDALFQKIPEFKQKLELNIELAKPTDFVPSLPGEEDRHTYIVKEGSVTFYHFDPYAQVFSKIERAHGTDIEDAKAMINSGRVDADKLLNPVREVPKAAFAKYPRLDYDDVMRRVKIFIDACS